MLTEDVLSETNHALQHFFNVAKCNLGKVKLERVGQRSSSIAVRDMRGGHSGIPRAPFSDFVASVSVLCLLCLLIIADQLCFLANRCGFTLPLLLPRQAAGGFRSIFQISSLPGKYLY